MKGIKRKLIAVVLALTVSMTMSSAIVFADSTDAVANDANTTSESQSVKDNSSQGQTEEATKDKTDNDKSDAVKSDTSKSAAEKSDTTKNDQNTSSLMSTSGNQKLAEYDYASDKRYVGFTFEANGGSFTQNPWGHITVYVLKTWRDETKYTMQDLINEFGVERRISREGYKFVGWSPELDQKLSKTATYYAQWEKLYTVTYDFDGGLNSAGESSKTYKDLSKGNATPTVETPTKEGYEFAGWNTTVADTVSDDVTYIAQWKVKIPDIDQDTDNPEYNDDKDKTDNDTKDTDVNKDTNDNSNINDDNGLTKSDKYYTAYVKETTEKAKEKKESKTDDSAKTGDNMPIGMLFGLMAVAAGSGALTLGKRRKEQE